MDGIGEDGVKLYPANLAREARVRSSYLEWCKENDRLPNENRYPVFESNYLEMENFSKESGTEMQMNAYADCLEEESVKLMAPTIPKEKKSAPPKVEAKKSAPPKVEAKKSAPPKVETKVTQAAPPAKKPAASKPASGGLKMPKLPQMLSLGTPMKESPEDKEKKAAIAAQKKKAAEQQREEAAEKLAEKKKMT
jgi:hypothetical protein